VKINLSDVVINRKNNEEDFKRKSASLDFSSLSKLIVKDLTGTNNDTTYFRKFSKDDVITYLEKPESNETNLRNMSRFLYNASPHYRRLINYFSKLLTFDYVIEPYGLDIEKVNVKTFKSSYKKAIDTLETMNIKHEFVKILTIAFKEDVYYGYEYFSNNSYLIQKLNSDYCKISSIEDGCYCIAFDFSYFDKYKTKLESFASEFTSKYNIYKKDNKQRWQELDSANTICIKINEDMDYIYPPFSTVFESLYDIQDYKSLKKAKTEIGNYKLLAMKLETRKDSDVNNDFTIDLDLAQRFFNQASESLPDGVGLILSPTGIEDFSFKQDSADSDRVAESEREYWRASGTANTLFGDAANSGSTLALSIKTDEEIAFSVLRQIERWINKKLKSVSGAYKFKVNMLDITVFNKDAMFEMYLKAAQFGLPTKTMACASLGLSPNAVSSMCYLENDILGLHDKFIPLQSSHTTSGTTSEGQPTKSDTQISESGENTRESDANANR
jgi:hypothetical protein